MMLETADRLPGAVQMWCAHLRPWCPLRQCSAALQAGGVYTPIDEPGQIWRALPPTAGAAGSPRAHVHLGAAEHDAMMPRSAPTAPTVVAPPSPTEPAPRRSTRRSTVAPTSSGVMICSWSTSWRPTAVFPCRPPSPGRCGAPGARRAGRMPATSGPSASDYGSISATTRTTDARASSMCAPRSNRPRSPSFAERWVTFLFHVKH